jgi:hypothetical protein
LFHRQLQTLFCLSLLLLKLYFSLVH